MIRTVRTGFSFAAALVCLGAEWAAAVPLGGVTVAAGTPHTFHASLGVGLLTDGVVDDDDWLTGPWTSMGWLDAGWNLTP